MQEILLSGRINRKTLNEPETYLGFDKVKIEELRPGRREYRSRYTGTALEAIPQGKKRFAEYLNPDVELGMSYRPDPQRESLPILQEGWQAKRRYRKEW